MWVSLLAKIGAAVAAFFNFLNREIDRKHGRLEANSAAQNEVMKRMQDAENIRNSGVLDDNLLLAPAERGVGGLQSLPADLSQARGVDPNSQAWGRAEDQSPQRNLGKELFNKPARFVNNAFIHCSASDRAEDDNVTTIRHWHRLRGFNDIGYHFYISKDGVIQNGRDIEKTPAAQEGHNTASIGICLGGLNKFTEAQFESLRSLCAAIKAKIPFVTFHGHCEVNPHKTCPNFDYKKVLCGI
jgi:hypothetical protein